MTWNSEQSAPQCTARRHRGERNATPEVAPRIATPRRYVESREIEEYPFCAVHGQTMQLGGTHECDSQLRATYILRRQEATKTVRATVAVQAKRSVRRKVTKSLPSSSQRPKSGPTKRKKKENASKSCQVFSALRR